MDKIFVNGLISKKVSDKAPEWILGALSINVESLTNWLNTTGKQVQSNGWINLNIKKSKDGKRYIEVDTYNPQQVAQIVPVKQEEPLQVPTVQIQAEYEGEATAEEIIRMNDKYNDDTLNDSNSLNIDGKRVAVDSNTPF